MSGTARIQVSTELFVQALNLPSGTIVQECWNDPIRNVMHFVVEHSSIPKTNGSTPDARVICQTTFCHYELVP